MQSIFNLVCRFKDDAEFYLFSLDKDIDGSRPDEKITINSWSAGPNGEHIFYLPSFAIWKVFKMVREINPDTIFINGIFNISTTLLGLICGRFVGVRIILSPRGMLQQGALSVKPFKKKLFLRLFKFLGLHDNVTWHATDEQEVNDIKNILGRNMKVWLAGNIVKPPLSTLPCRPKEAGELNLVYFSLITEKKNLHVILEALLHVDIPVTLHIYGTLRDQDYWKKCQQLMQRAKVHQIRYQGVINPADVQGMLQRYHCFILPTKGENFGHAIYESLSTGLPVILTPHTPWTELVDLNAGIIVHEDQTDKWAWAITQFIGMNQHEYDNLSRGALEVANNYFTRSDFESAYSELFLEEKMNHDNDKPFKTPTLTL